ncbi:SDR family NAD(P)-dependent oxidoreductase [Sulfitobacter aestuarii]|uniref:SDR family NAD(P)-dependent oxidoreductase n=1 Tax=Sulfitobacter aestuarii TaxID=2161676 RepID=A0ABW5U8I1_9RHOB
MADTTFGPKGWTPARLGNLVGKTYVITGANAGAGFQAARILLSKGAKVVMLNRSAEKSTAAVKELKQEFGSSAEVSFVRMDLAEQASVRAAAEEVLKTVPRIDALICNAAIAQVPTRKLTPDGFESQLGTNHYGHFTLCGMLFDRIEESRGRIVAVASLGYNMGLKTIRFDDMNWNEGYGANTAYSQSKLWRRR